MIGISLHLDGDGCWLDLPDKEIIHLSNDATPISMAVLPNGMTSGKPSVTIRIDLPDSNQVVLIETSWALLYTTLKSIEARYGAV